MSYMDADPSRTGLIVDNFKNDLAGRVNKLTAAINAAVVTEDGFGLTANAAAWKFATDAAKLEAYQEWFSAQVAQKLLRPVGGTQRKPWTARYVDSAYRMGVVRAYMDTRRATRRDDFYAGGEAEFLKSAFNGPEAVSKIRLVNTRTFEQLKGITAAMSQDISRTLATGLTQGKGAKAIARDLVGSVEGITRKRAFVLARTEIIHAHAEGQLDAFEELGVEELDLLAELSTAGDGNVCTRCSGARKIYTVAEARGVIPIHPQCRCCFTPYIKAPTQNIWKRRKVKVVA